MMEMIAVSYLFFRIGFANPIFGVGGIARVLFSFLLMSSIKVVTHDLIFFDTLPPVITLFGTNIYGLSFQKSGPQGCYVMHGRSQSVNMTQFESLFC